MISTCEGGGVFSPLFHPALTPEGADKIELMERMKEQVDRVEELRKRID